MKRALLLMVACMCCSISIAQTAMASTSNLTQTIEPIRCTYTVLKTGTMTLTPTQCSSQQVPTLSAITAAVKPRLTGTFISLQTSSLRIWVGEKWFTLGISNALSVDDDDWILDLADASFVLAPSTTYTVIVETTTPDGYLLSSVYVDILTTQAAPLGADSIAPVPINSTKKAFIPIALTSPLSQSSVPRYYDVTPTGRVAHSADTAKSSNSYLGGYWLAALIALLLGVIFARVALLPGRAKKR